MAAKDTSLAASLSTATPIKHLVVIFQENVSFGSTFGPSAPGALNLVAADTSGTVCGPSADVYHNPGVCSATTLPATTATGGGTLTLDADPYYDDCSAGGKTDKSKTDAQTGRTIGDLLNNSGATGAGSRAASTTAAPDIRTSRSTACRGSTRRPTPW